MDLHALTGLVAVVLSGSVVLVPVVALSVRFALKPLLLIKAAGHAAAEAADFHRQLAASAEAAR